MGASHQTGWTGLVAHLIQQVGDEQASLQNVAEIVPDPVNRTILSLD